MLILPQPEIHTANEEMIGVPTSTDLTRGLRMEDPSPILLHYKSPIPIFSLRDYLYICSHQQTVHMHVVHEKAFLYSIIVCLKPPTKRDLARVLKKEQLGYDPKALDQTMIQLKKSNGKHATTIMLRDPGISVIVFYRWNNNAFDYGTLTHELFHAVDMNLRSKGITLSDDSDETYAYHLGYFTREFLNWLWQPKK